MGQSQSVEVSLDGSSTRANSPARQADGGHPRPVHTTNTADPEEKPAGNPEDHGDTGISDSRAGDFEPCHTNLSVENSVQEPTFTADQEVVTPHQSPPTIVEPSEDTFKQGSEAASALELTRVECSMDNIRITQTFLVHETAPDVPAEHKMGSLGITQTFLVYECVPSVLCSENDSSSIAPIAPTDTGASMTVEHANNNTHGPSPNSNIPAMPTKEDSSCDSGSGTTPTSAILPAQVGISQDVIGNATVVKDEPTDILATNNTHTTSPPSAVSSNAVSASDSGSKAARWENNPSATPDTGSKAARWVHNPHSTTLRRSARVSNIKAAAPSTISSGLPVSITSSTPAAKNTTTALSHKIPASPHKPATTTSTTTPVSVSSDIVASIKERSMRSDRKRSAKAIEAEENEAASKKPRIKIEKEIHRPMKITTATSFTPEVKNEQGVSVSKRKEAVVKVEEASENGVGTIFPGLAIHKEEESSKRRRSERLSQGGK